MENNYILQEVKGDFSNVTDISDVVSKCLLNNLTLRFQPASLSGGSWTYILMGKFSRAIDVFRQYV